MAILVTGGAGYIGSHFAKLCLEQNYDEVVVLDDLSTGFKDSLDTNISFYEGDVADAQILEKIFKTHQIDSLVHFAAKTVVPESLEKPFDYYTNNTLKSLKLFQFCKDNNVKNILFSSTAAVYGDFKDLAVKETDVTDPKSPYGRSKYFTEEILKDLSYNSDFKYIIFRYFNVAGSYVDGSIGQKTKDATHLIKVAAEAAAGKRDCLKVFGSDYPTGDGSCIRDFIHVQDLAQAHLDGLSYLKNGGDSDIFNCGYGKGYSVFDIANTMKNVSKNDFKVEIAERREGDIEALIAISEKLQSSTGWEPKYNDIRLICKTAFDWELKLL